MKTPLIRIITVLIPVIIFSGSCAPLDIFAPSLGNDEAAGHVSIAVTAIQEKAITPAGDLEPAEYEITGTGPENTSFTTSTLESRTLVENLAAGDWTLVISAYNAEGILILEGTGSVTVQSDATAEVSVQLLPVTGTGTLTVRIEWPAEELVNAVPSGALSVDGDSTELVFETSVSGAAEYSSGENLESGWYQLEITLKDGEKTVMGAVELVGIFPERTTEAVFDFAELNKAGKLMEITDPDFTIAWDPPEDDSGNPVTPDSYNVYYRAHDTVPWTLLDTLTGSTTEYLVSTTVLDYGCYEFAVTSVDSGGSESDKHTSMDDTADPATGWYVDWKQT
jgi:hypothetical protein